MADLHSKILAAPPQSSFSIFMHHCYTNNNRKTGVNVVPLVNRFWTSSVKCYTVNFCSHVSKGPVIIMNQIKSIYNKACKDSHSHPIHNCFLIIASNVSGKFFRIIGWRPSLWIWLSSTLVNPRSAPFIAHLLMFSKTPNSVEMNTRPVNSIHRKLNRH